MSVIVDLKGSIKYYNKHLILPIDNDVLKENKRASVRDNNERSHTDLITMLNISTINCILYDDFVNDMSRDTICKIKKLIEENIQRWNTDVKKIDCLMIKKFSARVKGIDVVSRSYYKIMQIFDTFQLKSKLCSNPCRLHLCEAPGGFISFCNQAFNSKNYFTISLIPNTKQVPNYHKSVGPKHRIMIGNNDITRFSIINALITKYNGRFDMITGDGGILICNHDEQEELTYRLIASELYISMHCLRKGGVLIIKFFETFLVKSKALLQIISENFNKVYVYKPETSRCTNSEKYIVCFEFLGPKHTGDLVRLLFDKKLNCEYSKGVGKNINIANNLLANLQGKSILSTLNRI